MVIPRDADQRLLHETIYNTQWGLKAISRVTDQAQTNVTLILARVASLGIDAFLLACTELSFAVDANMYEDIPIFDSLNCMAREMITASCPDKLEPLLEGLYLPRPSCTDILIQGLSHGELSSIDVAYVVSEFALQGNRLICLYFRRV